MKPARTALIACSMLLYPGQAVIASGLGGDHEEEHGSHVHGTATLQVVLDNKTLEIKLSSPAVNLLGFEGAANTEEKEATADAARETLLQPGKLFRLKGVDCQLDDNGIELTGLPEHDGHGDEHHEDDHPHDDDHHEEGHHNDDHHDDDHHDDDHHEDGHHDDDDHHEDGHHDDDHHHEDGDHDDEHSDIVATYRFQCDGSAAEAVQLPLLTAFPGIETLDTQWIVGGTQGAKTLGQGDQTLQLR